MYIMSKNENYTNKSRCEKINESQLRKLIAESVREALLEAYSDSQYAHLAGQASGALDSFGGKVKGFFNPEWKKRKQRQLKKFADQATGNPFNRYSSTEGGENNYGRSSYNLNDTDGYWSHDFISNRYNPDLSDKDHPFVMQRSQGRFDKDGNYASGLRDDDVYSTKDMYNIANNDRKSINRASNVTLGNSELNNNFRRGRDAAKGKKTTRNLKGTFSNTTGTKGDYFKGLK